MATDLTYGQVLVAGLLSGALGGLIGAGSTQLVAWSTRRNDRADRAEARRVDGLIAFQDAVDGFMNAWGNRVGAFFGSPPGIPEPPIDTFIQLVTAQTAVRTTAARTGDRALIAEISSLTQLMTPLASAPEITAVSSLGKEAGRISSRLIFGVSEMIHRDLTWEEAVADMSPDVPEEEATPTEAPSG